MGARFEVELPRDVRAGRLARRLVAEHVGPRLGEPEVDVAQLLVSELVNNAVIHGEGRIELSVDLDADRLRVDVTDEGSGFEHRVEAVGFEAVHGRGLALVNAEASRWGIREGTTHVWFELERTGPRLGPE